MLFYTLLKFILKIALRVFFRRFQVDGLDKLHQAKGPLILAVNHPNTFMDPLIIATLVRQRVAFIANGSIFNRFTRPIFRYFHVIPVYRKKDTATSTLSPAELNKRTFQRCYDYLETKGTILIFPEGTSEIERRLREIKTGTARIALGTEAEHGFDLGVQILPIGLNYSDPTHFRSEVFVNVGEPIHVRDFKESYRPDSFEAVETLTDLIQQRLTETVIITEDAEEDSLVLQVEKLYKNQLFDELQLNQKVKKDEFGLIKQLITAVRYFETQHPDRLKSLQVRMTNYLDSLQKLHLSDRIFTQTKRLYNHLSSTLFTLLLGLPFYLFGLITNYIPYILPSKIARLISSDISYRAPIMMTVGILLFPIFYGFEAFIVHSLFQQRWITLLFVASLPLLGYFVLWYWDRLTRLTHLWQALRLFRQKPSLMESLTSERAKIFKALEEAKTLYLTTKR
ncbi:1-acyl-sn-glycerol-3-phosphate acyltransferase [Runella defluvii]|uniref:1-acyl-sn-glycerol-3-phosphate acyltransferase n=1 Tax=Runella defluvii TaxID=370973 RepID=A0A7W6ESR4_9BACT|nr:lysophospholipid acyltransferase family protein [Runella defluvii]MBB3840797.1 1-acyl-sn-glycerol-3-phosphate acyltransferase [Runella defluvii]